MNSIFGISKLVSMCVAVLYNYTKAAKSLDFSICFFPQNSVFRCCESPNIPTRSGLIFQVSLLKMQKCLWRCHQQPGLWSSRQAQPLLCHSLHEYSQCFCPSFSWTCLASSKHQFPLESVFSSDEKEAVWYVHPALLFGQFNENINKAQTGEGGAQSLGSVISTLHITTSFCTWAINTAINITTSWRKLTEAGKRKHCLPLQVIVRSI